MEEDIPVFSSLSEEVKYWKDRAAEYKEGQDSVQAQFDEFVEDSKELEAELESQLEQAEKKISDLSKIKQSFELENDKLKDRLQATTNEFSFTVSSLQDEVSEYSGKISDLQKYVRELEHNNDNLERGNRAMMCSLEDFEKKLNEAIEKNALLENEVEDKEGLQDMVQRLKDESRDLHTELSTIRRKSFNKKPSDLDLQSGSPGPESAPNTPSKEAPIQNGFVNGIPISSSAKISALNIVGDLLRKVSALETKLASCRNIVREPSMAAGQTPVHLRRSSLLLNSSNSPRGLKRTMQQPPPVEDGNSPQRGPGGVIKISVWKREHYHLLYHVPATKLAWSGYQARIIVISTSIKHALLCFVKISWRKLL